MKKQSVIREYNFPDAELYTQCLERILYIKRDLIEFKAYAYGEGKILAFEKMVKSVSTNYRSARLPRTSLEPKLG